MLRRRKKLFGGARFNPLVYSPALWLDASDIATLFQDRTGASASTPVVSNADPVGTWKDKSGNARHVTAASDAGRPTYVTGVQNSLPGIRFDRVNDYLTRASGLGVGGLAGYTLFGVLSYSSTGNQLALNAENYVVRVQGNGATVLEYVSSSATDYGQYTATIAAHIATQVYDGSQTGNANRLKVYTDGTQQSLTFFGTIGATLAASTSFTLGIADNDKVTAPFGGDWLELIVVPSVLSTADVAKFHRYLAQKWMSNLTNLTATVYSDYQFLEWTAVDMASSYSVYYRLNGATSWTLATTTTSTFAVVSGLTAGLTYDFRVDAEFGA